MVKYSCEKCGLPTTLKIVFPATTKSGIPKWLLKYRRWIGLLSFGLAVGHAYIYFKQRNTKKYC